MIDYFANKRDRIFWISPVLGLPHYIVTYNHPPLVADQRFIISRVYAMLTT